jgi:hypothetical protein
MIRARFVDTPPPEARCANEKCRTVPEAPDEGGWLDLEDGKYWCPRCATRFALRWHRNQYDSFRILNLPDRPPVRTVPSSTDDTSESNI